MVSMKLLVLGVLLLVCTAHVFADEPKGEIEDEPSEVPPTEGEANEEAAAQEPDNQNTKLSPEEEKNLDISQSYMHAVHGLTSRQFQYANALRKYNNAVAELDAKTKAAKDNGASPAVLATLAKNRRTADLSIRMVENMLNAAQYDLTGFLSKQSSELREKATDGKVEFELTPGHMQQQYLDSMDLQELQLRAMACHYHIAARRIDFMAMNTNMMKSMARVSMAYQTGKPAVIDREMELYQQAHIRYISEYQWIELFHSMCEIVHTKVQDAMAAAHSKATAGSESSSDKTSEEEEEVKEAAAEEQSEVAFEAPFEDEAPPNVPTLL